ncbi:CHAT domain-containing protein [Aquimarina sp. M1]
MNLLKTIIFFLLATSFAFSQTETVNDTIVASQYFKKADSLLTERKLDSAIVYYKKALPIYEKAKAWERVAGCYNGMSKQFYNRQDYEKSIQFAEKTLEVFKTTIKQESILEATSYHILGNCYRKKSVFDKSLFYYQKALDIRLRLIPDNHDELSESYFAIGLNHRDNGIYDMAIKSFEKGLKIWKSKEGSKNKKAGNFYFNLGTSLYDKGDYSNAIIYYKKALDIHKKVLDDNHVYIGYGLASIGNSYSAIFQNQKALEYYTYALNFFSSDISYNKALILNNIGTVFLDNEDFDQALENFEKTLDILEKLNIEENDIISIANHNVGLVYDRTKEYERAIHFHRKGLIHREKSIRSNHPLIGDSYMYFGNSYMEAGEYDLALKFYFKALNTRLENFGTFSKQVSETNVSIAIGFDKIGNYNNALSYYDKALEAYGIIIPKQGEINFKNLIDSKNLNTANSVVYTSIAGKANVNKEIYKKEGNPEYLERSKIMFGYFDNFIGGLRLTYDMVSDKNYFSLQTKDIYKNAIETQLITKHKEANFINLESAFHYLEKSKANTLTELLNLGNAKTFSGLSSNLIDLEKDLRIDKAFYQSKINEELSQKEIDSSKISGFESKLFDIARRQDSLTEVLEKNYPKYHQLKYNNEVITVAEVQERLDENTTVLEFFTADSTTYAFTISKNKMNVKELPTPKLGEQVETFRAAMTKDYEQYQQASYGLYQTLIAPMKEELSGNQLIIVPDGPLWHLNFDLLFTQADASNNPRNWPYLLKDYAISYANSATLLFRDELQEQSNAKESQECLAFSFSSGDDTAETRNLSLKAFRSSSMDLPGTREEIKSISNIVDGQYFYGSEATEQNFKKHAGSYNILHLALHGDVDNERPENSKLYFTKSKDTLEDNYLYSHELFALDIPAELTVLSACNTGTGKIAKGEGIMSLGNAFQYAGTKSLLLTNWEVSDDTTPKIMEYFYTNLKDGKNKAEALQQAKLQFLATTNQETDHPYYWGGFYLLGDTTAIQLQDSNQLYWWIGFGILALILVSLFWYRRRHSVLKTNVDGYRSKG